MIAALVVLAQLQLSIPAVDQLRAFSDSRVERLGCLLGEGTRVDSLVATDDPTATSTVVVARAPCPPGALGRVHSHPGGMACFYTFPGTSVPTADLVSARRGGYPLDVIVCGSVLIWLTRDGETGVQVLP